MRKQVQKERCTKIMLTKCKAVCCLYDKVQLAAAKMLDAEPAIFQFECNVPILCNDIPANDLNLPSETYTTDFVLHYDDGHTAVREAVFRSFLSRPSVAEKLELSRRYWQQQGSSDWGIIIDKEDADHTLLPRVEGKITQRGLEIFGLRFSNCTFKKRFVAAGLGGRETVQVAYAPECMDTVWLYENGTYSAFDLVQKAYLSKSLAEIADAQQQEKVERTDWKKQELQAQLDLMSDIQAIADRSERTMPDRSNISKQIQRNRSTARKQESVSLMDLLAEQQEDDFDAR